MNRKRNNQRGPNPPDDVSDLGSEAELSRVAGSGEAESDAGNNEHDVGDDTAAAEPDPAKHLGLDDLGASFDLRDFEDVAGDEERAAQRFREPSSSRTAREFSSEAMLRRRPRPPDNGWRRFAYEITGGAWRPRPSRSEREREALLGEVRKPVTQPRRIAVISRKGGVGKTTTALMLGHTLASHRGDRVVAVDGNPDAGSLAYRVNRQIDATLTDLLKEAEQVQRYADMRQFTSQSPTGLEVIAANDDPQISRALGEEELEAVISLLDRFYNLVVMDTGTGILEGAIQGILDRADQVVLVVSPSLDAARAASQTFDWLNVHGYVDLVETAVTVLNQSRRQSLVDVSRIEEHFWDRCGATVRVPWDPYLEAGAETEVEDLRPVTREAYLQLAAAVAQRFDA